MSQESLLPIQFKRFDTVAPVVQILTESLENV